MPAPLNIPSAAAILRRARKEKGAPDSPRLSAARIIAGWLSAGRFPDRELAAVGRSRAFVTEIVFGVVRHYRTLRFYREKLAFRQPAAPIEAVVLAALYELYFLDDTQAFAAVHEAVEAARELGGPRAAAFVNAVLRRSQREAEALRAALQAAPAGVRWSHPDALLARWQAHYGEARTRALCAWNNERPETVLHVMKRRAGVAQMVARAAEAGLKLEPHPARPADCLVLPRGVAVEEVPGYSEGWFIVQDPSTLGAVDLLAPQPGETIVDACASPGGKAAAIRDRMTGTGRLVACDIHEDRMARLRENFGRLQMGDVTVALTDAADRPRLEEAMRHAQIGPPDAILLDVPCSNTGVLRRRVDARWRFSEVRLAQLTEIQARMLAAAAAVLRAGGRIVYSTCSLEAEENERQIQRFLASNHAFQLDGEFKPFPPESGMDGAFAARLVMR